MTLFRTIFITFTVAPIVVLSACAEMPAGPSTQPAGADTVARPGTAGTPAGERMAMMEPSMTFMREMHDKMMQARTPEERNALRAEHMKAMQEGMVTMNRMGAGGVKGMHGMGGMPDSAATPTDMAMRQRMMEKQMEMMQSMMQMMMDQMPQPVKP